ncbi:phage tail spike protein [Bacillus cereus]|nr:phage tail spike protein [Bacillus cereus]
MKTPSGTLHVVDFKTEQIVSAIQTKDYWGDKRHWEIKNNVDTLEFKVFSNNAATLIQQNWVLKEVRDGRIVPYVIIEDEKDSKNRSVTIYAQGAWVQLAKAGIIKPQKIEGKTVNEFIDLALFETKWKRGRTEYSGFHTMTIDKFIDPLKFLKDIASLFELEIQYLVEVVGSQIVGWYVDMVKKRGMDTGKEFTLGKDLTGIRRIENSQNICTALVGFARGQENELITVESINNGLPYIVDNEAFQRWNERGQHKFGFYSPETENDITPQRLLTLMNIEIKKRINTSVSYEVNAQSIGRVFGLEHEMINEGDSIRIKDTGFTPKLYLEARAIAGDESFTDPTQDKYVFGDYREITDANEELRKMYNKILAVLGNKASKELLDKLEELVQENDKKTETAQKESEAAKQLAEKVVENLKNYQTSIIESTTPPTTGLELGKTLWLDISRGKPGILKKWNGTEWEVLIKDYGQDVKSLDERTAEVETSMKGLTSDVKQLSITTTDQGKQITDAHTKIEQNSQAISAKVDIKQVEDYVGGIGPTNEIRNTRFTQGTKYWGYYTADKSPLIVDKDTTYLGDFSLKLSVAGQTGPIYNSSTSNRVAVTPGEEVVVSAYFMTKNIEEHLNKKLRMVAVFWKKDGTQFTAGTNDFTINNDTWTRQEFTKVAPPEAALVGLRAYVLQNGTFWLAHPMLQKGTKASSFIENPNDMVDKDKIMEDLADKVATQDYNQKVTDIERRITANEKGIELSAKRTDVYTKTESDGTFAKDAYVKDMEGRITVTENNILNTVKKGEVISSINQTAESIKIQAKKIDLQGAVTADMIKAGELNGTTIRTDSGTNYVHIQKQFIRLMESNLVRVFLGYYYRKFDNTIQPTILLGGDYDLQNGTVVLAQTNATSVKKGFLGVVNGRDVNGDPNYPSSVEVRADGNTTVTGNNVTSIKGNKGVVIESKEANFWVETATGVTFKISNPSNSFYVEAPKANFNCQVSTTGVNVAGGSPDSIGTIKYMNGFKGWGYYGHIGSSGWANFTITV